MSEPVSSTSSLIRRLWRENLHPYWRLLLLNLLLIALVAAATGSYPLLINWAFERFEAKDHASLVYVPLMVILATSLKGAALYAHLSLTNSVLSRVVADLQSVMYRHLIEGDFGRILQQSAAALAGRFTTDLTYIREAANRLITTLVRDMLTCVCLVGAMFYLDWVLALVALTILPLAAWPVAVIGQKLRKVARRTQEEIGEMNSALTETLAGVRLVKTYRLESHVQGRVTDMFEVLHRLRVKAANHRSRVEPVMEALGGFAVAGVLALIGWRIGSQQASLGEFTGFVSALLLAAQPMRGLGNLNAILQEGLAAAERVFDVLDTPASIAPALTAPALRVSQGRLAFEDVSFAYEDGTRALDQVRFDVAKGQTLALVGRSGAGKSTIFSLIPRLFDSTSGQISIDGQDIRSVSIASLRDAIGVVAQDVTILNDTAAGNIGYGRLSASREEIIAAAKAAAAHDFILSLPQSYETPLGVGGVRLSGGQRQRIALARAMLKNAPILLLDEATSALDAESERLVGDAFSRLKQGRTTLVIAHRLETVRDADQILVLDQGRVVEQGRHEALLAQGGLYAQLYRMQFRED